MRLRPPALDHPCDGPSATGPPVCAWPDPVEPRQPSPCVRDAHAAPTSGPRSPVRRPISDRASGLRLARPGRTAAAESVRPRGSRCGGVVAAVALPDPAIDVVAVVLPVAGDDVGGQLDAL